MYFSRRELIFAIYLIIGYAVNCVPYDCVPGCVCKWKGGKKTVECIEKGMIMIPDGIDPDTLVLNMSGNNLQVLSKETFQRAGLINLQKIYLKSCRIGQIDDNAFRGVSNLIELDLTNNLLTFVPSHSFFDIPYLRDLNLAKNPIQKIDPFAFKAIPSLVKLDLSFCNIQSVGPKAFEYLEILEFLKLNDNKLTSLPVGVANNLRGLRSVELHNNSWKCDCHLRAVREWLAADNIHIPTPIYCSGGPDRLRDQQFLELSIEDFACKPQIKTDSRLIEVMAGTNATIDCRVESDPIARISWYWNGRSLANYSLFSPNQRIFIDQKGENIYDMRSKLTLVEVEETDAGQYYCIAENRAGNDEANFTLSVMQAPVGIAGLTNNQMSYVGAILGAVVVCLLLVIVLLVVKMRRSAKEKEQGTQDADKKVSMSKETSDTSSTTGQSHDSVYKDAGKAFTITSDLSYSRSFSDIGNPQFGNPDLITSAHVQGSNCVTPLPITRPISDYSNNWQKSYDLPRAVSSNMYPYDVQDRVPIIVDTVSAGSGSDEVFVATRGAMVNDYPPDYGLPILPENEIVNQPGVKTLKVWQRGVPVYPPMCNMPHTLPSRHSPDVRSHECGTDV